MYRMQQIVLHDFPTELPKCMYTLQNLHAKSGMVDQPTDHVIPSTKKMDIFEQNNHTTEMAQLGAKQDKILQQLAELKERVLSIRSDLSITAARKPCSSSTLKTAVEKPASVCSDIVINANPASPPYSIEIIQKLLKDTVGLSITSHRHSTTSSLSKDARELEVKITEFSPKPDVPKINIRLIWKNVNTSMEFLVSHLPLLGEVNFLRYLSEAVTSPLSYVSTKNNVKVDSLLDTCHLIINAKTKTERIALLQILNKSLLKSHWLLGKDNIGVADVAAYSAIRQASNKTEMSANLVRWFQRCETVV